MSSNRFYTILIVPEKTSQIRQIIIPRWIFRGLSVFLVFGLFLIFMMLFDYGYVMSQLTENKHLRFENRRLKQNIQFFENKLATIENTIERVKTFSTRLKVIMQTEEAPVNFEEKNLEIKPPFSKKNLENPPASFQQASSPILLSSNKEKKQNSPISFLNRDTVFFKEKISELNKSSIEIEDILQKEYEILYEKKSFLAALPTRQPVSGHFTSGFGIRASPFGSGIKMHEGLDIANQIGTTVYAPADGEVTYAAPKGGYGLTLILNHGYGLETWYGHLKKCIVFPGDKVKRGMQIALLGKSGRSTGPHVHYEVRVRGYPVDPLSYIFEDSSP